MQLTMVLAFRNILKVLLHLFILSLHCFLLLTSFCVLIVPFCLLAEIFLELCSILFIMFLHCLHFQFLYYLQIWLAARNLIFVYQDNAIAYFLNIHTFCSKQSHSVFANFINFFCKAVQDNCKSQLW